MKQSNEQAESKPCTIHGVVKCTCEPHNPATKWKGDNLIWYCEICKKPC